ncbi:MAG: M81 family metallopeptidase [Oscillospiraceae bacterium]|nr:M81 family metallopeptidase [Oscillospiraceae bacterium]
MKVLIGSVTHESNMFTQILTEKEDFHYFFDEKMIEKSYCGDIFAAAGVEVIPTVAAHGGARGYVKHEAYEYIREQIIPKAKEHRDELDGIYLFLHGASHIVDLPGDSMEHALLEEIRGIVGPSMPIGVSMDPHGNVSARMCELANVVRCFRESPHIDQKETIRHTAELFLRIMKEGKKVHPAFAPVPILIGGERCVSFEEPLCLINERLNEAEKIPGIMSASYHVGFAWADSPLCTAAVVVVPESEEYAALAQKTADELADYAFSKRFDFHFTGNALPAKEAWEKAYAFPGSPVFVSDSGDNVTAGALGFNTVALRQILAADRHGKKTLIASIFDEPCFRYLARFPVGAEVEFSVGTGIDADAAPVPVKGKIKARGDIMGFFNMGRSIKQGEGVVVSLGDIDLIIANDNTSFAELDQFAAMHVDYKEYGVIIIKQGYLFPELKEVAAWSTMALTPGATDQLTENFDYKTIHRPMFPVDKDFTNRLENY